MSQIIGSSIELFQVLLGDADGDVDVDSYDAASVLNYSVGTNILSNIVHKDLVTPRPHQ